MSTTRGGGTDGESGSVSVLLVGFVVVAVVAAAGVLDLAALLEARARAAAAADATALAAAARVVEDEDADPAAVRREAARFARRNGVRLGDVAIAGDGTVTVTVRAPAAMQLVDDTTVTATAAATATVLPAADQPTKGNTAPDG